VGQNWGARRADRSRRAMWWSGLFCIAYGLGIAVLLYATGGWFAGFFTEDPAVIEQFTRYLEISVWGYVGFGLLIVANGALNAVDRAGFALAQSAARVFLVMLPFGWVLRAEWGSDAIYAAELVANLAGGLLAALIVWRVLRSGPDDGRR
jgi:Na+-driven multidrug efflux pump